MIEQLAGFDFIAVLSMKFEAFAQIFDAFLTGGSDLKIFSIGLILLAIFLFLVLVAIVFVRTIILFFKSNNPAKKLKKENDDLFDVFEDDEQQELEKELQRELEMALSEKQLREQKELEKQRIEQELLLKEKNEKSEDALNKKKEEQQKKTDLKDSVALDWQKNSPQVKDVNLEGISLSYEQNKIELNQLMGLAIDMLGRGVDDLKIAQTLNFKSKGLADENSILKAIDALKYFIDLSLGGKFVKLDMYDQLPKEDQALYHLANGDPSLALALLENLMDTNIDKANAAKSDEKRQALYDKIAEYACCFGALAELNDIMLATSAYELAIELQSGNVTAWGHLGDVYKKAGSVAKANWAYQNVINFADEEINAAEIANARKNISEFLYAEGNSLQAAKLYNSSKQYYDSLGINRRLDKQELDVIEIIETNHKDNLPNMIYSLLGLQRSE